MTKQERIELVKTLPYEERQAFLVLYKAIPRNPKIVAALMQGQSEGLAVSVLMQARKETEMLLEVCRAFSAAAQSLVNTLPENTDANP